MERKEVFEDLKAKLEGYFGCILPKDVVLEDLSFTNDLGFDSLDMAELITKCDAEFNARIPDDVAERLDTLGDLIDAVLKYQRS